MMNTEDDLLILKTKCSLSNEEREKSEEKLSNITGKKVVILPEIFDVASDNYNKKRCVIEVKIDTDSIVKHMNEAIQKLKDDLRKRNTNA